MSEGKRSGRGKQTFPNGDTYVGCYKADSRHGIGATPSHRGTSLIRNRLLLGPYSRCYKADSRHGIGANPKTRPEHRPLGARRPLEAERDIYSSIQ